MAAHKMFPLRLPYPLTLAWAAMTLRWRGSGLATWTAVDITGHETLDAFECLMRQKAIESQSQQPPGHCGDSCS